MRLICPNCDAQYEVPDEVVPTAGRDVQCSNCGQTWFQHHADYQPGSDPAEPDDHADEEVAPPPPPPPARTEAPQPEPARKDLDEDVAKILREEAAEEQQARRQRQSEPLESQPDLGLDEADDMDEDERRSLEARQRMARMRGEPEPMSDADAKAAAMSSRRDLLPDIEEINSTLRNDEERAVSSDEPQLEGGTTRKRRRGFRRGLFLMLLLFILLIALYIFAPQISKAVPQLESALTSYVAWVDQLRTWLDGRVQSIAQWLDSKASQSGG
jgi:predicted Zn finger-like uncharacterized protein